MRCRPDIGSTELYRVLHSACEPFISLKSAIDFCEHNAKAASRHCCVLFRVSSFWRSVQRTNVSKSQLPSIRVEARHGRLAIEGALSVVHAATSGMNKSILERF